MRAIIVPGLLLSCLLTLGCGTEGPKIAPVKGVVTLGGKPLDGAEVTFRVKDSPWVSVGVTNDKGEFELTTLSTNDGAIVGENLISIRQLPKDLPGASGMSPEEMQGGGKEKAASGQPFQPWKTASKVLAKSNVPPNYGNPEKSGLKRSVVVGLKNEFNFDLKP